MHNETIEPGQRVPVRITRRQRVLITEHSFADQEVTKPLAMAETKGGKLVAKLTLDELDELCGYLAAEANHAEEQKLQRELDALFEYFTAIMESYDDGTWRGDF